MEPVDDKRGFIMTYNGSYVWEYELVEGKSMPNVLKRVDFSKKKTPQKYPKKPKNHPKLPQN